MDGPERLGEDDLGQGDSAGQAEGGGGVELPFRDCLEAAADDLGDVGAVVHGEGDDERAERREPNAQVREPEIDEEELDQARRVPDHLDVGDGEPPDGRRRRHPRERGQEADDRPAEARAQGDEEGEGEPAGEDAEVVEDDGHELSGCAASRAAPRRPRG